MVPTSLSLLDRLRSANADEADWEKLQQIYRPLIQGWARRVPGLAAEADDLTQDVMVVLVREIGRFERQREGSFRAWLRQILIHRAGALHRSRRRQPRAGIDPTEGYLEAFSDPRSALAREWDAEHDALVFRKLLATVQPDFQPNTWEAFRRFAIEGQSAVEVARELSLSVASVLQAKSRVLKRLRQEAGHLMD